MIHRYLISSKLNEFVCQIRTFHHPFTMSELIILSKQLSRWLRHRPDAIGINLDSHGWVEISTLIHQASQSGITVTDENLRRVVAESDKQRFTISEDRLRIRAAQGHSVSGVDLNLISKLPPPVLYHGTVSKFIESIKKQGLLPGTRNHVHLSATIETAQAVGGRRGVPVVLKMETFSMVKAGIQFKLSENGVWLVDCVPAKFITFP